MGNFNIVFSKNNSSNICERIPSPLHKYIFICQYYINIVIQVYGLTWFNYRASLIMFVHFTSTTKLDICISIILDGLSFILTILVYFEM